MGKDRVSGGNKGVSKSEQGKRDIHENGMYPSGGVGAPKG